MRTNTGSNCPEHGIDRHVAVHEAGHAVSAIDEGIAFKRIINFGETGPAIATGRMAAGVELPTTDATEWVPSSPVEAVRFLVSGSLTESVVLGHYLREGYLEDIEIWKRGMGLRDGVEGRERLDAALGVPFADVMSTQRAWVSRELARIEVLAERVALLQPGDSMPYDDVVAILESVAPTEGRTSQPPVT